MSRTKTKVNHAQIMAVLSQFKDDFIVNGRLVGPSNLVYCVISRFMNNGMSASSIYTYAKRNKEVLLERDERCKEKENNVGIPRERRRTRNFVRTKFESNRDVGNMDDSSNNDVANVTIPKVASLQMLPEWSVM
ncbi:hypothetical protein J6590_048730 [Homalodisca vitripennis]|nr:hypothetical protein J6590_048730 [Homalodisca vitripennis]